MPVGGNFTGCNNCGPDTVCEAPTEPLATVGLCLADGSPIAVTIVRDCAGAVTSEGWINLSTGAWSAGQPPAGTIACGDSRSITTTGTFCDVAEDGAVLGLVLVEYQYAADGSIAAVRLVDAVTGDTYVPQGEVTTCPAGVEQPERDMTQLCDTNDDESGAPAVAVPFLRDYARDENGVITGHSDYTLDGAPYTPLGTVGVCQLSPCQDCEILPLCDVPLDASPAPLLLAAGQTGARSGTLANGVGWASGAGSNQVANWFNVSAVPLAAAAPLPFTFTRPVSVTWSAKVGRQSTFVGQLVMPPGTELVTLSPDHLWDPATRTLSPAATAGTVNSTAASTFSHPGPLTALVIASDGTGGLNATQRVVGDLVVTPVTAPLLRTVCRDCDGVVTSVTDTALDGETPYTATGTVGICQPEDAACTDAFTQMLCDESVEVTWTQTSVVPDPTQPDGRGFIYSLSPADDPSIVGTIRVLVDRSYGSCGAPYWPGGATFTYELDAVAQTMETLRVNLEDFDTAESITMLAGGAPDRLGGNAYVGPGGVIRSNANNAYGYMFFDAPPATLTYRFAGSCTGLNFNAVSTRVNQFLRKITTDCETGEVVSVTDTTLDGQPYTVAGDIGDCSVGTGQCCPDSELLALCDTADDGTVVSFLRHLVYPQGGGTPTATDTALDGVTEYVPAGTVSICQPAEAPCRDSSSTLLCDTAATDMITVFDPANVAGSDGWEVVAFTGANAGFGPEAAMPYPAPNGAPFGYPAFGARADQSAGSGGSWAGYDAAPVRWVLRKTFTAPEDGVAVAESVGFRGDGGARVRINGVDAGMYGQWNLPATSGTAQIPITAGPNTVEIEVRDTSGINNVRGRLDISMPRTVQFMRRQTVDCDTGEVIATHDTTLDGEPYTVAGEVGQCEPVAECCEQAPPEQRVDVETELLCVRDEVTGEVLGQVIAERVYDDQSGDLVEQRLTDLTGAPFTLPDGSELAKCPSPDRITRQVCVVESGVTEFLTNSANATSGVDSDWQWSPDLDGTWHPMYRVAPNPAWTVTDTAPNQAHWVGPHVDRTVCPTAGETSPPVPETWYTRASWNLPVDVTPESIRIAATVLNADNDVVRWRLNDGPWQPVGTAGLGGAAWTFPPTAVPGGRAGQNEVIVQLFEAQPAVGCPSPNSAGMLLHVIATYDHEPLVWTQVIEPGGQTYYLDETGARQDTIPDGRRLVACDSGGPATQCQDCETLTLCDSIADEESPGGVVLTEYEPIPLSTLPPAGRFGDGSPVAGVLANGVAWTVNVGTWDTPQDHYSFYPGDNPQTWTFDQPVYLRIGYRGLNISPQECYRIPEGAVLESLSPAHTYDAAGRYLCEIVGTSTAADESVFTLGPVTVLDVDAVGSSTGGRGLGTLEVAIEDEQPGPVEPGGVVVPFLRTVCRDCDGVVTSTTDTTLDGEEYTVVGVTTVCSSTGGSSGEAPAQDIEVIRLCDLVDGADAVPFLRHLVYTAGVVAPTVVDTTLDGVTPYAAVGDAGVCPVPTPGRDVELVPMCVLDNGTGASIQEIYAEVRYDAESGERVGVTYVDPLTWGPVALPGGTHIGLCPAAEEPEPTPDVEVVQLCDMVGDAAPVPFLRHLIYTAGVLVPTVVDTALDGTTPYAAAGTVGTCAPEPEECQQATTLELCDVQPDTAPVRFLRTISRACDGTVTGTTDTTLDGVTPYTVAGEVGSCDCTPHVLEECRWDDTTGDGVGDVEYVELITVDGCTGDLSTLGTYLPDLTGPYTPVAPVASGPVEGAPPVRAVQAHRMEVAAGGTWSAASVPLLQAVTMTAHGGTATVTTDGGTSTLYEGESVSWSVVRDDDAALVGPLAVAPGTGTVTVAYTRTVTL